MLGQDARIVEPFRQSNRHLQSARGSLAILVSQAPRV